MKSDSDDEKALRERHLLRDPHPQWTQMRKTCPVERHEFLGKASYAVHRFEDVEAVLRDSETFSSSINQETMGPYMGQVILAKDGQEHTSYRNLVSRAFRASQLERWESELIQPTIDELVDAIAPAGHCDLVADITSQYPVQVIAGIIGVPVEDHARFHAWAEDINMGPLHPERGAVASRAMREYLTPIVEDRKANPRGDLISDIATAEIDGERLDDEHIYGFLRLLMPAGAETTFRLMGNCFLALLSHPAALERAKQDDAFLLRAIEETLRWETSVTMVNRVATRDTEIRGVPVGKGSSILLHTSSGNRDESRWDAAREWDPEREDQHHLAFGWGRHLCLGMHLARLELRVGIGTVLRRLKNLALDLDPSADAPEIVGFAFRGPERLPVRFDPVAATKR